MVPRVEFTEGVKSLNGKNKENLENNKKCSEKDEKWVSGDGEYFLVKVVLEAVGVDEKVSAKETWHPQTEQKTLEVDDSFGEKHETREQSKVFVEFSVWVDAGEAVIGTLVVGAES